MSKENPNQDCESIESKHTKPMSFIALVIWTGLFGGIFWSSVGFAAYYLNFTDIRPNVILEPWALGDWKRSGLGTLISIIIIGIFSTGAAFIYYLILRKCKNMWGGIGFGIALFVIVFILFNPIFPSMDPFLKLKRDTLITSVCLYVLYGVFVGYTISYEENEIQIKQKKSTSDISGSEG
ncbi:YqhR family membrane protein [Niallia sp. 01092]|uniref:YqhR family membrane protein n=1 Tax=unclassified Niallia TaxID=2837522 RepID=UPI003FD0A756